MKDYILVGCDLHDESMLLKVAHNDKPPKTRSFGTSREARQKVIEYLKRRAKEAGGAAIKFAYEASTQGYGLYDDLSDCGVECYVLAPTNMHHSPKSKKRKTDEKDAQSILEVLRGHFLAGNELPSVWVPDHQTRDDRELVRARLDLAKKEALVKAQIRMQLKRNNVSRPKDLGKAWTLSYRRWLSGLCHPECPFLGSGSREELNSLLRQLEFHESEIKLLDVALFKLSLTDRYKEQVKELLQFKGVGPLTAMVFLTEIGDMSRFKNRRQIAAYLGLVPSSYETGEGSDRKGHITHQGSPRVRRVLCQSVWSRLKHVPEEKAWYDALVKRNPKRKKIAVVACMRRLSIRLWHKAQEVQERLAAQGAALPSPQGGSK